MSKCEACRYFDCGEYCKCVCHSRFAEPEHSKLEDNGVLVNGMKTEEASMEGLSSLFG